MITFRSNKDIIDGAVEKCVIDLTASAQVLAFRDKEGNLQVASSNEASWWLEEIPDSKSPFIAVVPEGEAYHKDNQEWYYATDAFYRKGYNRGEKVPWNYIKLKVTDLVTKESAIGELRFHYPIPTALQKDGSGISEFFGKSRPVSVNLDSLAVVQHIDAHGTYELGNDKLWLRFLETHTIEPIDKTALKAVEKRKDIAAILAKLPEEPMLYACYNMLHYGKSSGGVSNNQLIAAMLKQCKKYEDLAAALNSVMNQLRTHKKDDPFRHRGYREARTGQELIRELCVGMPGAQELVVAKDKKKNWAKLKSNADKASMLGIDEKRHKLTHAAISAGKLPAALFHEPGKENQLVNIEFDLWEKSLKRKGWAEVLFEIAARAATRGTYTHRMSSYMAFMFKLENFLQRHTEGRKRWKCMPRFVQSESELSMTDTNDNGTVKERSALTPQANLETRVVTVPYAALRIYGFGTSYCYSDRFVLFEEGMNDPGDFTSSTGGVVEHDLAEKLNGRDDYGLMYYTLTGTARNQGYPTFLIIFERTNRHGTRVHFHRVHPNRSKNGNPTPSCRLIEECYRFMAGNVRAENIDAQQGDLIFTKKESFGQKVSDPRPVASFESHAFIPVTGVVTLRESTKKTKGNLLGWIESAAAFMVDHPEHEPLEEMSAGIWEIRRCKSFEANPNATWSGTID